jgi:hypothetical protein
MKLITNKLLMAICLSFCVSSVKPISEEGVAVGSVGCGVASGVGSCAMLVEGGVSRVKAGILSTLAAVGGGFLGYKFLAQFTSHGRLKRALKRISRVENNPFLTRSFSSKDEMINSIKRWYVSSDWPLVSAKLRLDHIRNDLIKAISLLNTAMDGNRKDGFFCEECEAYKYKAEYLLEKCLDAIGFIRSDESYSTQYKLYQKDKELQMQSQQLSQDLWNHYNDQSQRERHHREVMAKKK